MNYNLEMDVKHMIRDFAEVFLYHMEEAAERRPVEGTGSKALPPSLDPGGFLEELDTETGMYGRSKSKPYSMLSFDKFELGGHLLNV
jgi:hypothetical protein